MKRISIFIQLVLVMFIISAIPAISVIYINSMNMRKNSEEAIAEAALNKIQANKALGDEMLTNIIYDALDLILAKQYAQLNGITSYAEVNSDYQYVNAAMKMKTNLTDLADRNKLIHSIFYYMDDADYVVSTDYGLVRTEHYDSLGWLANAIPRIRGGEGIWYPRPQERNGVTTDLVSYLYRSSNLYTSTKITVVINVYESELSSLIYSGSSEMTGDGFLINGAGEVIAHSNREYLYTSLTSNDYIDEIIQSRVKSGSGITEDDGFLYTYERSDLYNWIYVNVYSLDQVYAQSKQITQTGIGMTLLIILIGASGAVLLSLRISRPIKKLTEEIKGHSDTSGETSKIKNEIAYLSDAFGEIKERERNLKDSLTESEESVRRGAISNLFHGETLRVKEQAILEAYFPYSHFIVCMIYFDGYAGYQAETSHEERKFYRRILYEALREMFPAEYRIDSIRYNTSSIGLLINVKDYDSNKVKSMIYASLSCAGKKYQEETRRTLSMGVSQVHNYFDGIKVCVSEAGEALKHKLVAGKGTIHFYQKVREEKVSLYNSYQYEKRIMNYLELGDMEKIEAELAEMIISLKRANSVSIDNMMLVFNQLIGMVLIYLGKHNYTVLAVLSGRQSSLYSELAELETIDDIKEWLAAVYKAIIDYQNSDLAEDEKDYTKAILQYIKKYYATDIDFEQLASEIGISYSYARKIIRETTGKSLIDNLNYIRVEAAKSLLDSNEHSVADIATVVGYHNVQSLYRFFLKFEGVSPGDYKNKLQTEAKKEDKDTYR